MNAALVWCPFADEDTAARVANALLDEGLVVCANLLSGMRSLYVWNGERHEAGETGALFKTRADLLENTIARIAALHPYDQPAVLGWECEGASPGTRAWLQELPR